MTKTGCIYKIVSPTGRVYIGKTVDFTARMGNYRNGNTKQQKIVHASIQRYGWENHQVEILAESSIEQLADLEIKYIKEYSTYVYENPNGMNLTLGGDGSLGRRDSDEVKTRRSAKHLGTKRSFQTRKLMSELKKGITPTASSLPRSEKQLMHLKYGNIGREKTVESLEKWLDTKLTKFIEKHEAILQYDLHWNLVREWVKLPKHVAKENSIDDSYLLQCLKIGNKVCKGYYWKYKK
jgi:group I intron endonuclease